MKKTVFLLIFSVGAIWMLSAQQSNETAKKELRNEVKRSENYLYGQATADTKEDAVKFSKKDLECRINEELLEHYDWQFAKTIQGKDVEYYVEMIDLRQGSKYYVIAYIKKESLKAIFYSDKMPEIKLIDKKVTPQVEEKSQQTMVMEMPTQQSKTIMEAPTLQGDLLTQIVTAASLDEIQTILISNKRRGKVVYGTMDKLFQPEEAYFIVYNIGEIVAILDKEYNNTRRDLISGKIYGKEILNNNQILWFQLFNN